MKISPKKLFEFIDRAGKATYSGGGKHESKPERNGFYELTYSEPPLFYRDSYVGHSRSGGQEIVRLNNQPIWWSGYGGGMTKGMEKLSHQTFEFLKLALSKEEASFESLRGPRSFVDSEWSYQYEQMGDVTDFQGYEEIFLNSKLVFFHRAIGGSIDPK